MRELAFGKVNLCLFLGGVREDGRHELVTLIESVSVADELEVTELAGGEDEVICEGVSGENLVATALRALRSAGWEGPPLRVEIRKRIPVAAGMGGGSADAAAILRVAATFAPVARGGELAAGLGADVPSQLSPGLSLGVGAGDEVEPLAPLEPHAFVIVPRTVRLSTAEVYREADRLGLPRRSLEGVRERLLVAGGKLPAELLVNDLEPAAVSLCPEVALALEEVRRAGADHALVCGSGPTVAGLWWGERAGERTRSAAPALGGIPAVPVSSPASGTIEAER